VPTSIGFHLYLPHFLEKVARFGDSKKLLDYLKVKVMLNEKVFDRKKLMTGYPIH
jgi:hypothetical protein